MPRNPHAPKEALALEDLKPGLEVVIVKGGSFYCRKVTIASKPYKEGEYHKVKVRPSGSAEPSEFGPLPDFMSSGSMAETEEHLADMGLCPGGDGRWSVHFTVRASDYNPLKHF